MAVITPDRGARAVVSIRLREVVGRAMHQLRHAGHDDLAHVRGDRLFVFFGEISIDGISHLRIEPRPRALEPGEPQLRLGQRAHAGHAPVALRAIAAVARFARHVVCAADERPERVARERHHLALHERRDFFSRAAVAVRRDRIVVRVDHRRQRRLPREADDTER